VTGGGAVRVTVQTVSDLSHHFGSGEFEVTIPARSVGGLLEHLKQTYGFNLAAHEHTMLFVNGRGCVDPSRTLRDGDHVAIVPILAAG
jgi:molybdopterin converting factor small subunit